MKLIFRSTFTRNVAYPGLILLITLSVACAFFPERSNMVLTHIQNWIYANLSWSYILIVSFFLIFLFVLAFSKIGNIRLGADNSAPQYSFFFMDCYAFCCRNGYRINVFWCSRTNVSLCESCPSINSKQSKRSTACHLFPLGTSCMGCILCDGTNPCIFLLQI